ncbi:MAG: flavodoxin [Ruminococcaceae bacterium]|nr:flavodoxin [Oscillospiraceae bacterium]
MKAIVIYKSKYGSTKTYAEWIAEALSCKAVDTKTVKVDDLDGYDTIIYGGGLYAEVIAGVSLITKNLDKLKDKKLIVYSTGITPLDCRDYYDKLVLEKNFKGDSLSYIKVFNFLGKMILSELSLPHRTAIRALKKLMSGKENPTEMEKLLIELCDADGDFTDKNAISDLVAYAKN